MAKRIIIALFLIILSLSLAVSSYLYIKNTSEKIIESADAITEMYFENKDISLNVGELLSLWNRHSMLFSVILKHSDADVIGRYFLEIESALECGDNKKIYLELSELTAFLSVTVSGEAPVIENIF